jgi:rhodanese-related sulfurtransferase
MVATLTAHEAAELLAQHPDYDVIDVRDVEDYAAGHIPAARVIPLDLLRTDTDRELAGKPAVLFVCQRGNRSLNAAKMAERLGYEHVYNLDGGTSAWAAAGLPIAIEATRAAA